MENFPHPPKWANKFLQYYCKEELFDEISGDLEEAFFDKWETMGANRAKWFYIKEVVKFFRPFAIKRIHFFQPLIYQLESMFHNYLISALRTAIKHKGYTSLNILGLVLGMAGCLLILQYVTFELSYNKFHEKAEQIYRISYSKENNGVESFHTTLTYSGIGKQMLEQFPEIINFTRLRPASLITSQALIRYEDQSFEEEGIYYADSSFFNIFSFPIVEGNSHTALKEQFSVVISESMAYKYFGDEDPIGKTLRKGRNEDLVVTAIMKDTPPNSHFQANMLISHSTLGAIMPEWWTDDQIGGFHGHLYILTQAGTNQVSLTEKFPKFVEDFIWGPELREANNAVLKLWTMSLTDIHLHSHIQHEAEMNGDADVVQYLAIIAALILIIALVNYINLSTARALQRAREVGIRKVAGAFRSHLIGQFLFEAFVMNTIAVVLAIGVVILAQPIFDQVGASKVRELHFLSSFWFGISCLGLILASTIISGVYPAIMLSQFKPISVLKGGFVRQGGGAFLRKTLVVFQFAASIGLIIGTMTIYQQISFMRNQQLGINIDHTIVVKAPRLADSTYVASFNLFRNNLLQRPNIEGVAASHAVPGMEYRSATWFARMDVPEKENKFCYLNRVDEHFIEDFEVNLLAGRNFMVDNEADRNAIIINETALKLFGYKNPDEAVGTNISVNGNPEAQQNVIGVISDYHQQSLKLEHSPVIIGFQPGIRGYYSVKVALASAEMSSLKQTIEQISTAWEESFAGQPLNYFFLRENFDKQYQAELSFGKLISVFSLIAIIVGCLGLLGLITFTARLRTKEIGIRKVLGSNVGSIVRLLIQDFLKLFAVSSIIAWGVCWYFLKEWLQGFAFRIELNWVWFVVAALFVAGIAILTISYQVLKAAYANPVKALRYE